MDYRLFLDGIFNYLKERIRPYSYQRFAEDLGYGHTTIMHQVIRGYRPLSAKAAKKIGTVIGLDTSENAYFTGLVAYNNSKSLSERRSSFDRLLDTKSKLVQSKEEQDILQFFSAWYHPVIHELVGLEEFVKDPNWIATKIFPNIKPQQAQESLDLLLRLGYIQFDEANNTYKKIAPRVNSGHRVRGMGLLQYHLQMIDRGIEALNTIPGNRRNVATITLSCDEDSARKFRDRVNVFLTELLDEAERQPGDQIYQVNVQLFPFTLLKKSEGD
jgi:uncharacterized protein (TIGR02147 family)